MNPEYRVTDEQIKLVVHAVATEFFASTGEPIPPYENHDHARLLGALAAPFQSAFEEDIYPTTHEKAAALFYFMAKDHPFENGNKRIAVVTLLYYLAKNGLALQVDPHELYKMAVSVVASKSPKDEIVPEFAKFIEKFCLPYEDWVKKSKT